MSLKTKKEKKKEKLSLFSKFGKGEKAEIFNYIRNERKEDEHQYFHSLSKVMWGRTGPK